MADTPSRAEQLATLRSGQVWDVLIIGGGASGLGAAVDAAERGYRTLLLERGDYASGTSSRSTKLIHGGVRYLRQGDLALVRHALIERRRLLDNAGHLVLALPFIIPARSAVERLFYRSGLKLYDLLAGAHNLAPRAFSTGPRSWPPCPDCWPKGCVVACATGTASSTTPGWPSR
ncbi:FAD-dependent oxidoreductase [Dechloromonas sp. A34]|uniref:FAD-dependent oxidoreductase n=1 Tax=Dechloromonas sp. A34 TaxID=447588 RepID=UPI0022495B73|nr:FAD-dependent oxidoreductase [Dechloromonas sp. A34]